MCPTLRTKLSSPLFRLDNRDVSTALPFALRPATPLKMTEGMTRYNRKREFQSQEEESNMPMYPEIMVVPMRAELTRLGIEELRTADEVDAALKNRPGTTMVVVNSICGCAAGRMRPAVRLALQNASRPDHAYSVFAGQEKEATEQARSYFTGQPPSSPSIAILRDGQLVYMMPRRDIESRETPAIAAELKAALDRFCAKPAAV